MNVDDITLTDESSDETTSDNSGSTSTAHLYMVENGDPDARGAALNHNEDAYDLLSQGGDLYNAWRETGGNGQNVWSRSDVASHVLAAYAPLTEIGTIPPQKYTEIAEATVNALVAHFQGNTAEAMNLYEPDESDLVDYAVQSDDISVNDVLAEIRERGNDSTDDDSDN